MTRLLVLGGARSGKSRLAQDRIEAHGGRLAYIATAQALDDEMAQRISRHREDRGRRWHTIEAPLDLPRAIGEVARSADAVLVDCLTLWLSNLILAERSVAAATDQLLAAILACGKPLAMVSNEVGYDIVPDNALARRFRDEAGRLNQKVAQVADEVVLTVAGLPLRLKP
ncbi:MAG: bifunctional adenosylcobinamide kinase/adenosylcobinamide-phosphate guanylyltransferase [Novosphingobium sp.]